MQHLRPSWDGTRPPSSIHQVWDFLSQHLRETKDRFRHSLENYYGKHERMTYITQVNDALKVACDSSTSCKHIGNYLELEELLKISPDSSIRPKQLHKAQELLKSFVDKTKIVVVRLSEVRHDLEEEVVKPLETYCSKYTKLGIADDKFFKSLKARTMSVRSTFADFDQITLSIRQCMAISHKYFSDRDFSQEVAFEFDCETYPVLRLVPDLVQKLELVMNICQDWLRSDKVYLEQIQREVKKTGDKIKEVESQSQLVKLEYDRMFSLLKQKQAEYDDMDESFDHLWKNLAKLEAAKTKIDMEISAIGKTLRNCRDQLRDLSSVEHAHHFDDDEWDDVDCAAEPEDDPDKVMRSGGHAHSSYKSRLCRDARAHSSKIDYLRRKKKRIEKKMAIKKGLIQEMESSEADIQQLSKKLRVVGKKKAILSEEVISLKAHMEILGHTLDARLHPVRSAQTQRKPPKGPGKKCHCRHSRKTGPNEYKTRSKHSAELHRAFRVVKNSIGHNWKDLVRVLPYFPAKQQSEINNEIRVIEYENQGQLKEQAYQAMVNWHNHVGRRASLDHLKHSLREISENRLADHLDKHVVVSQPDSQSAGSESGT